MRRTTRENVLLHNEKKAKTLISVQNILNLRTHLVSWFQIVQVFLSLGGLEMKIEQIWSKNVLLVCLYECQSERILNKYIFNDNIDDFARRKRERK